MGRFLIIIACLCGVCGDLSQAFAQFRPSNPIQVLVSPDRPDWTYDGGEEVVFTIRVLKNQVPLDTAEFLYTLGLEQMTPMESGTMKLADGNAIIKGSLDEPGFLRCRVSITIGDKEYVGLATAGYMPDSIQPTQVLPNDFWEFWNKALAQAAKVPMDPRVVLLPDRCNELVNVYQVNLQNNEVGSRLYGILAVPKAAGDYPVLLRVPGAGIRAYDGLIELAEKGIITFQIGVHGVPVILEQEVYQSMGLGPLRNHRFFNLDDRDSYYYKRVYLGCVRAIDYLTSLPNYDGTNLAVWGGSQGGALAIVTAALDDRVSALVAQYPALCDMTGYLSGRAGGWPHMFNEVYGPRMATERKIATSAYYDVVNFSRSIQAPGFYTWGFNDEVCPPTSMYAAYNLITAPKELLLYPESGHWYFPEQYEAIVEWLIGQLKTSR